MNHYFISYSSVDGYDFAIRLRDELEAGEPPIPVWFDKRDLQPGQDWDNAIGEALKTCAGLIFVMTIDSVEESSVCKSEWTAALRYKKPIILVKLHPGVEMPFRLVPRQHIDFTRAVDSDAEFYKALAKLRTHLRWRKSPEGTLAALKERLADAQRDLRRAADKVEIARIQDEINLFKQQIAEQQQLIDDPTGVAQRVVERIKYGLELELERQPERSPGGAPLGKFINPPPAIVPAYFQGRQVETRILGDFLKDDDVRMITVVGRGGVGKTALVCRILKSLERGQLPDGGGPLEVDGIVYLSAVGTHRVNAQRLYSDLAKLLPDEIASDLDTVFGNPQAGTDAKMSALLSYFREGRSVVLIDGFDDLIDAETLRIRDAELFESLRFLINAAHHTIKVIVTTRLPLQDIELFQPSRQRRLDLDVGLTSPYAENFLREMDADGKVGLRDAPDELLKKACERTRGIPRALEALFAILSADRETTLQEILDDTVNLLPENIVGDLFVEAFSRLDDDAQRVMQALAIFGDPVPPAAVDFLLQPFANQIDSGPLLRRLVAMQLARHEGGRFFLHPFDGGYALNRVPLGTPQDKEADPPSFTQSMLFHRGAEYFKIIGSLSQRWHAVADLEPQLAEFDLRCAAEEYDIAGEIVLEIESYLLKWNALQQLLELYERLQGRVSEPEIQKAILAGFNNLRNLIKPTGFELLHTLSGHTGPVTRLAWSPDGETLATASFDSTIRIWNVRNGSLRGVLSGHTGPVLAVAFTDDSLRLISASRDLNLKVWDVPTLAEIQTFHGHKSWVTGVMALLDGQVISASQDGWISVWNQETGTEEFTLGKHTSGIHALTLSPDGQHAISAAWDGTLSVWDLKSRRELHQFALGTKGNYDLATINGGTLVAAAGADAVVRVCDLTTGLQVIALEGPTASVTGVSASFDGRFLTAKSADGFVRLWRSDTWELVSVLSESSSKEIYSSGVAFSPNALMLATLGESDTVVRIWKLDPAVLLKAESAEEAVQYTTTKIVLLGESGVGKTGLGWRLAHNEFKEQSSTHGHYFWIIDALRNIRPDRTECEVILWDFAGQPDYRLIHALYLDDVDVALILFDPTKRRDALKPADYWLKDLLEREEPARTILVGARIDRGAPMLTPDELKAYCQQSQIVGGYVGTSAYTGEGVAELLACIKEQVNWDEKLATVSPKVFMRIKDTVLKLRESQSRSSTTAADQRLPLLLSPKDLSEQIALDGKAAAAQFTYDEMMTAVRHLAKHGYVSILKRSSGEEVILLLPDLLNNLAASIVLEARRTNFGTIDEKRLLNGEYNFPELEQFKPEDREILLDAGAMLFLRHNLCFRKTIKDHTFLVFPSLINEKQPLSQIDGMTDDVSFVVSGAVETVYPTIVVQLSYTNEFERTNVWQNQAQYEMGAGEICGFRQVETGEGEVELVLYYGSKTPDFSRMIFQGYFEKFLHEHQVKISKFLPLTCPDCRRIQERATIVRKIREGESFHFCGYCGTRIELPKESRAVPLAPAQQEKVNSEQIRTRYRAVFESTVVRLKRLVLNKSADGALPRCFISYAWGVDEQVRWVIQLATDLRNVGIDVVLDRWANAEPGASINRFISQIPACEYIAVVGTPEYRQKYENEVSNAVSNAGSYVAAEFELISNRLTNTKLSKKETVMPLLLAGEVESSFPPLLHGRVFVDFRQPDDYFPLLSDMFIKMCGLAFDDRAVIDLRESMRAEMKKLGP